MSRAFLVLVAVASPSLALAGVTAGAGGPYTAPGGGAITLTASSTGSIDCGARSYRWDTNNDGTWDTTAAASASTSFSAADLDGPTSQTVKVEVSAFCTLGGGTATATATVTITNADPVIGSVTAPTDLDEGETGAFSVAFTDAEAADTHTISWDFGDGTDSGASVDHAFADEGTKTVTVTVTDDDGGVATSPVTVRVANVAPTIDSSSWPSTGAEGEEITFTAAATDPGADTLTYEWTFGDGETATGASVTHAYGDQGSFGVTVTVRDGDGGSDSASGTISIANVAPVIGTLTAPSGDEGDALGFAVPFSDGGADDTHTIAWDFGDGGTDTVASPTHTYVDDGTYTVSVEVCDDDGACDTDSASVTIANVAPTVAIAGDVTADEGTELSLSCSSTDPGTADVLTTLWDFGDEATATTPTVKHAWQDNGTFVVSCAVSDDDGGEGTDTHTVTIANVAPTIVGTPDTEVVESEPYEFAATVSDPGGDDTHSWSLKGPSGMTLDASTNAVKWSPTVANLGSHSIELSVTDDDGAKATLTWTLEVKLADADGDGMSDGWETEVGLDPDDPSDAALDPDGDGRTNLDEWGLGTDPFAYDGPSTPVLLSPADGAEVADVDVALLVENSVSPVDETLTYQLEVYDDAGMTSLVTSVVDLAEDASGETAWTVDVALTENTWYFWWATAADSWTIADWSEASGFFYNTVNDAPGKPSVRSPRDGTTTTDRTPLLELDEAVDPDEDALVYSYRVHLDGTEVVSANNVDGDGAIVGWSPDSDLTDGEEYCWYAFAVDPDGLEGPRSDTACFVIDTSNEAPSAPVIDDPLDGAVVVSATPTITVTNGVDPEGRGTVHRFEVDRDPNFASGKLQTADVDSGTGTTTWTPEALDEDAWYHLRVLASDGAAESDWAQVEFFVNATNAAPSVPALHNPADGAAFADGDSLSVVNAEDPEGSALSYEFVVRDDRGADVQSGTVDETATNTSWTPDPLEPGSYTWTARAIDDLGLASAFADERTFTIAGDDDTDVPDDTDDEEKKGCGCTSAPSPSGMWGLVVAGILLLRGRRR